MTDNNEPLNKVLKEELDGLNIPSPDPAARREAITMAREAFEAAHSTATEPAPKKSGDLFQGLLHWLRPIIGNQADKDTAMIPFRQKLMYSGVATAAVAVVAVGISLQDPPRTGAGKTPLDYEAPAPLSGTGKNENRRIMPAPRREEMESLADSTSIAATLSRQDDALVASPGEAYTTPVTKPDIAYNEVAKPGTLRSSQKMTDAQVTANWAKKAPTLGIVADAPNPAPGYQDIGRDDFETFEENAVKLVSEEPVSTFSADVDTASYSFVRRMLNRGVLPQSDAVRVEEMVNYFDYNYALPTTREQPFMANVAISDAPWAEGRKLMHIGIKGFDVPADAKPRSNLVFLLDVSGSMNNPDKLPLVKQSMELLLSTLEPDDTVAIAVYAGAAGTVLEPTPVKDKQKILDALRRLSAGGSTAGGQGIRLAYELAESQFEEDAINRVILATDGDFNVGISDHRELQSFIERKRDTGVFLSVLGFGQGNYHDALMQTLAQNGNGVAAYIDTLSEAQKLLVDEASSTLFPIAKDVKLQVEFNPATVSEYRLIGYETRKLNREDFNNDAVDAGDIGAGHSVTAIYEFTPVGSDARMIEASRYAPRMQQPESNGDEYAFLKIRYKLPNEDTSKLIEEPVTRSNAITLGAQGLGNETGFATAVASFAQMLKGGKFTGDYSYDDVIELAQNTKGDDPYGYRTEFIQLVRKAKTAAAMQVR